MKFIQKYKLNNQMIFWFSLILILPLFSQMFLYSKFKSYIEETTTKYLETIAKHKVNAIESYASEIRKDVESLAYKIEFSLDKNRDIFSNADDKTKKYLDEFLLNYIKSSGYYDAFLINANGDVVFSVEKEGDLHTNLNSGKYKDTALAKVFHNASTMLSSEISNFEFYQPSNRYASFIAHPIFKDKRLMGVVALQINNDKLYEIVNEYTGLGESGEIVVGAKDNGKFIFTAPLRHNPNSTFSIINPSLIEEIPIFKAINGEMGTHESIDYRLKEIIATWRYIPSFRWGIVVKIDKDEVYRELHKIEKIIIITFIIILFLLIAIMYIAIKSITQPIANLGASVRAFAKGDLDNEIDISSNNEIGDLAKNFNDMRREIGNNLNLLREQAVELEEQKSEIEEFSHNLEKKVDEKTKELKEKNRELKRYNQIINENVITSSTDLKGLITYVSEAFIKISGYTEEELIGNHHNMVRHPNMLSETFKDLWEHLKGDKPWEGEIQNLRKDGTSYWVKSRVEPLYNKNEKIGYISIRQDITDKKIIEELSITDALTQLYNRRHFNDVFEREIKRTKRDGKYFGFLIMDIDHFKQYNDTYGHQAGDDVLTNFAKALKSSIQRGSDFAFRLGGEEFGLLFSDLNVERSLEFANTVKDNIEKLKIEHSKNSASPYITASMGLVVQKGEEILTSDEIYKLADEALYKAKESGRNRVALDSK